MTAVDVATWEPALPDLGRRNFNRISGGTQPRFLGTPPPWCWQQSLTSPTTHTYTTGMAAMGDRRSKDSWISSLEAAVRDNPRTEVDQGVLACVRSSKNQTAFRANTPAAAAPAAAAHKQRVPWPL